MAPRVLAPVTPDVMRWARESAGYSLAAVAEKLRHPESVIEAWEAGEIKPSLAQAKKIARIYRYPLNVLYLKEIPESFPAIPDLRSSRHNTLVGPESWSPNLRWLIRQGYNRQEIARELLAAEGAKALEWVGSESIEKNYKELASQIREWLNVSIEEQFGWTDEKSALSVWTDRIEGNRAFVHYSNHIPAHKVTPSEMRGIALSDKIAPFIILNNQGTATGHTFTLMHELVHLWIGENGISDMIPFRSARTKQERIESYCNRVAAEILIPGTAYENIKSSLGRKITEEWIENAAREFKVSRDAMACRAREQGDISWDKYLELHEKYSEEWENRTGKGRINWPHSDSKEAGRAFSRLAFYAYQSGALGVLEVSNILNVKIDRLPALAKKVNAVITGMGMEQLK